MLYLRNKNELSLNNFKRFDTSDWDSLKKRISYKLVNKKVFHAQKDTEDIVYTDCMDLSKIYIVTEVSQDRKNIISYALHNQDLEKFNKDRDELYLQVYSNYLRDKTKRIYTLKEDALSHEPLFPLMKNFDNVSLTGSNMLIEDTSKTRDNILIVTNKYDVFGASYMTDPTTLKEIYNRMRSNFYILPMSIHQFMCVNKSYITRDKDVYEAEDDLLDVLYSFNTENKNTEDILSYKIYEYLADDGETLWPIKQRL